MQGLAPELFLHLLAGRDVPAHDLARDAAVGMMDGALDHVGPAAGRLVADLEAAGAGLGHGPGRAPRTGLVQPLQRLVAGLPARVALQPLHEPGVGELDAAVLVADEDLAVEGLHDGLVVSLALAQGPLVGQPPADVLGRHQDVAPRLEARHPQAQVAGHAHAVGPQQSGGQLAHAAAVPAHGLGKNLGQGPHGPLVQHRAGGQVEQPLDRAPGEPSRRLVGVHEGKILGVQDQDRVRGLVQERPEALQFSQALPQFRVVGLAHRAFTQADEPGAHVLRLIRGPAHRWPRCPPRSAPPGWWSGRDPARPSPPARATTPASRPARRGPCPCPPRG